jgi:hypothetical protein
LVVPSGSDERFEIKRPGGRAKKETTDAPVGKCSETPKRGTDSSKIFLLREHFLVKITLQEIHHHLADPTQGLCPQIINPALRGKLLNASWVIHCNFGSSRDHASLSSLVLPGGSMLAS